MASQSLYRKHRPQQYAELVGQDHVIAALRNAVKEDRVGHAYLFSGPRGTGKTTTARLLAKALNCLKLDESGEPCGVCDNCLVIASGTFYDLVELDAASNRGIDAMKELIQKVHLGMGATSRRKIYVIDEVHMLTTEASNTLLKTLEEPPEHVVFILATTDPQKVLPTIRSRTQHFEFNLFSRDQLLTLLREVLDREGVQADADVLDLVARRAAGSARDALSLLDQALAIGGGRIDAETVRAALGGAPFEGRLAVLQACAGEDVAGALAGVHDLLAQGHDVRRVADDLLRTLRDAFMVLNGRGRVPYDGPAEEAEALGALAQSMGNAALVRAIELLGQAIVDVRQLTVADPRLVLEVAVVRVARREARTSIETLLERVERLERQVEAGPAPSVAPAAPGDSSSGAALRPRGRAKPPSSEAAHDDAPAPADAGEPRRDLAPADFDDVVEAWPQVLAALKPPVAAAIQEAQPIALENGAIVFGVTKTRHDATNKRFRAEAAAIKEAFAARLGFPPRFLLRVHDFDAPGALRPGASTAAQPATEQPAAPEPEPEVVDLDDLVDAPDAPPTDSLGRLVADLGAQVLDERPRE